MCSGLTSVHHAGRIVLIFDDFAVLAGFWRSAIVLQSEPVAGLRCRPHPSSLHSGMVISIFLAVDRGHVRGVSIESRARWSSITRQLSPSPEYWITRFRFRAR